MAVGLGFTLPPNINTDDKVLSRFQDLVLQLLGSIIRVPILSGRLLESISLATGQTTVNHKLGRKLLGWIVVRTSAAVTINDLQTSNENQSRTLVLNSTAPTVVNLWVF